MNSTSAKKVESLTKKTRFPYAHAFLNPEYKFLKKMHRNFSFKTKYDVVIDTSFYSGLTYVGNPSGINQRFLEKKLNNYKGAGVAGTTDNVIIHEYNGIVSTALFDL